MANGRQAITRSQMGQQRLQTQPPQGNDRLVPFQRAARLGIDEQVVQTLMQPLF
jgi:hypothetical protein